MTLLSFRMNSTDVWFVHVDKVPEPFGVGVDSVAELPTLASVPWKKMLDGLALAVMLTPLSDDESVRTVIVPTQLCPAPAVLQMIVDTPVMVRLPLEPPLDPPEPLELLELLDDESNCFDR